MTTALDTSTVVSDRIVFEWHPEGELVGVITGWVDDHARFNVERVLVLRPGGIVPMLRAGMDKAREVGCRGVVVGIPAEGSQARGLAAAARRVGCTPYAEHDGVVFYEAMWA